MIQQKVLHFINLLLNMTHIFVFISLLLLFCYIFFHSFIQVFISKYFIGNVCVCCVYVNKSKSANQPASSKNKSNETNKMWQKRSPARVCVFEIAIKFRFSWKLNEIRRNHFCLCRETHSYWVNAQIYLEIYEQNMNGRNDRRRKGVRGGIFAIIS